MRSAALMFDRRAGAAQSQNEANLFITIAGAVYFGYNNFGPLGARIYIYVYVVVYGMRNARKRANFEVVKF